MPAKVAIITRTRDRPLLLPRAVQSVLNQTFHDWLHVIVNDGGDPTTVEVIASRFAEQYQGRLRIIHNPVSVGMQNASNIGIHSTESEFIAIHDDDDTWHAMFLEECLRYLDNTSDDCEQGVAVQSFLIMEEMDSVGNLVELSRHDYLPFESISLFQLAARNLFPPIAFLYRRKAHDKVGFFDQKFNELGDHDFNLRFLTHYDIGVVNKRLAGYHWRRQTNGNSYGNTVTDGVASHRRTAVKMRNHYLREDLATQRVNLGFLLNISNTLETQGEKIQTLANKTDNLSGLLHEVARKLRWYERVFTAGLKPWKIKWPRRVFDYLADWRDSRAANQGKAESLTDTAIPPFLENTSQNPGTISLEVFDAALVRLVRKSTDVFLYMEGEVRRLLQAPGLGFVAARIAAQEESCRQMRSICPEGEITLDEIYRMLRKRLDCDEKTVSQIKQLELGTLRKLFYVNPQVLPLIGGANSARKLEFVYDQSLPSGFIKSLLQENGFPEAPLSRSVAQTHTWKPRTSQTPLVDQHNSLSGAWESDLASSLCTGLVRRRRNSHPLEISGGKEFWEMIGYEVIGPLHYSFLSWVINRSLILGLKKLFFLSRDGYSLEKGFQLFGEKRGISLTAEYVYASRRLWNVASIVTLDEETMCFLATPNPMLRVRDFLSRVGMEPALHEKRVRDLGFKGLDELITTERGVFKSETFHQSIRRLFRELEPQILEQAGRERKVLHEYFQEIGLFEKGVGIVDLGWAASSSRALQKILTLAGKSPRVPGFYFGTWKTAQSAAENGCPIESLFMNFGEPFHRASILSEGVELVEVFFSAPHPTVIAIEKKNGEWRPVYGEPETGLSTETALNIANGTAFEFMRDMLELTPANQELAPPFGYLETVLERILRFPRLEEAIAFGTFGWRNTFGGHGPLRHLASPPPLWKRILSRKALQEGYDNSYWKKGFLTQLGRRERKYVKI